MTPQKLSLFYQNVITLYVGLKPCGAVQYTHWNLNDCILTSLLNNIGIEISQNWNFKWLDALTLLSQNDFKKLENHFLLFYGIWVKFKSIQFLGQAEY